MERYDPQAIERKWQQAWERERAFYVPNPASPRRAGQGAHVRARDAPVPVGRAAHGARPELHARRRRRARPPAPRLPACCARWATTRSACRPRTRRSARAATRATSPSATSRAIRSRCKRMGWAIDWDREVSTHEPDVLPLDAVALPAASTRPGLAYRKEAPVKWCPNDQTVLANEQVIDGRCERCGAEVEARNLEQWFFQITAYADRAARRDGAARVVARARADDAAQLDRPLRGRRDRSSASRSSTRTSRSSRRGPTRSSARRSSCSRRSIRWSSSSPSAPRTATRSASTRATRPRAERGARRRERRRRASSPALHADEPGQRASASRSGSPTTC